MPSPEPMLPGLRRRSRLATQLAAAVAIAGCALPQPGPELTPPSPPAPPTAPSTPAPAPAPAARLAGSSWYWIGTSTPAGVVAPADPAAFNLEFLEGGQLAVQLDCNTGGATWSQSGSAALSIGPLKSTRKACPAASGADRFARQLALVRSAQLSMGLLELSLGDAGTMVMARDPDWRLRSFDCPRGGPLLVAFGREHAAVRWSGRSWSMRAQSTGTGVRYATAHAILFSQGNDASLVEHGRQLAGPCSARR
jgi:heat shock protein HslJ